MPWGDGDALLEAALAAAGVAAVGLLLPTGRVGPLALWVTVVVPLWVASLLLQRRAALAVAVAAVESGGTGSAT